MTNALQTYLRIFIPSRYKVFAKACVRFEPAVLCSSVPIWPVLTEIIGSVTGSLASGRVCPDTAVCLIDQSQPVFNLHGYMGSTCTMLRAPQSLEGLLCKGRAVLAKVSPEFIRSITKSLLWMV